MILETILSYKSIWRVFELFAEAPGKTLTRPELKKYTLLGNESLSLALNRLSLANILIKIKNGKKESYRLNLTDEFALIILELCKKERTSLHALDYDTIIVLSEFIKKALDKTKFIKEIILFGSIAKHTATKYSDIDLAIITTKKDLKQELAITSILEWVENSFKRKIQIHYFIEKEFELLKKKKHKLINEIIKDGIRLMR